MAFNSAAIEEFKDIWVFCEQRDGKLMNTDFELISEGRKLADERGSKLVGIQHRPRSGSPLRSPYAHRPDRRLHPPRY